MSLTALFMAIFPDGIAAIYSNDQAVCSIARSLIQMAAVFQIFDGLQIAGASALRGMKDTKIPMVITIVSYWMLGFPLAFYLGMTWSGGPRAMWIGLTAGLVAAALLLNARFYFVTRRAIGDAVKSHGTEVVVETSDSVESEVADPEVAHPEVAAPTFH
jgi:MATE family multidrug resistance protein